MIILEENSNELDRLISQNQSSVPNGWDYLTLPRRVNLARVMKPNTVLKEDYFSAAKNTVRGTI